MNNEKQGAVIYGSGIGSLTSPSHKLGHGVLFQHLKGLQVARDLGKSKLIKQFATVGYKITDDEREKIIENRLPIWDNFIKATNGLTIRNNDGSSYGNIELDIFHSADHERYPYFKAIANEVAYRSKVFDGIAGFEQCKDYANLQTAQFLNFLNEHGTLTKIGWSFDKKHPELLDESQLAELIKRGVRSEYFFDQYLKVLFPELAENLQTILVQGIRNPKTGGQHVPYNICNGEHDDLPNAEQKYSNYAESVSDEPFYSQTIKQQQKLVLNPATNLIGEIHADTIPKQVDIVQEIFLGRGDK